MRRAVPTCSRRRGARACRSAPLVVLLAAALCVALFAPGTASAAPQEDGGVIGPGQRPQLLLIHGGSFLFEDPEFEPLTRAAALSAGFVPHYVTYPLDNLPAAVERVRAEARRLREKFGLERVYAYGASAGGTLAALLSGDELVSAAVAKAPISDLVTWTWPESQYGPSYWESLGVDMGERERLSPIRRAQRAPLLLIQGRADNVVPPTMNQAFAAVYPRVKLWMVAGGHLTERARPLLVTRAMEWLGRIATQKAEQAAKAKSEAEKAKHEAEKAKDAESPQ
ncbi:MAG TPA: prolyl oligopeptidase family serine peptidase [Solirubrobacterales bacterium]|nr:prolyl oligopeptidase family serine peptidase [Solirubrobacterales bacterium]